MRMEVYHVVKVKAITQQLAMLHEAGHELILVSSGAIAAGFGGLRI